MRALLKAVTEHVPPKTVKVNLTAFNEGYGSDAARPLRTAARLGRMLSYSLSPRRRVRARGPDYSLGPMGDRGRVSGATSGNAPPE